MQVKTFDDQAKLEIMKRISNEVFFATAEGALSVSEASVVALLEDCYDVQFFFFCQHCIKLLSSFEGKCSPHSQLKNFNIFFLVLF